ncbi:hypothetical protein K3495_g5864 [Podosphaera aphanis]|nr:hypothetical protein K3495_g5864 [Podosphaera aphanis]
MDIHRCRFVPLPPSSINSLAFSCSYVGKGQKSAPPRLAVGRANGDIEIWSPNKGLWFQETIMRGGKDRSIDGLVWTQDPNEEIEGKTIIGRARLFSIGYTTTVTEWDLSTGRPLRQASGNHGEIWCIAAQPAVTALSTGKLRNVEEKSQALVVGCIDGALVLYSTNDDDLRLQKILVRPSTKKAKIISVTFQNRDVAVIGCTDSTIRIFDIRHGTLLRAMTLGSGPKGGPKDIIVWSVKSLDDGTIISGDSTGELKIWDGKTYTLRQRILSHKQDILCLAVNADSSSIVTAGMDRRTVMYKPVAKGKGRWIEVAHRRFHIHDVKSMATFEGAGLSVFISGGHDASPIVVPLEKYGFENHRTLPFLPQDPPLASAPKPRLLMSWWDREVRIWRFEKQTHLTDKDLNDDLSRKPKLVAKIYLKGEASISSAALNLEGNMLAVATTMEIKVFQLCARTNSQCGSLQISKLEVPSTISGGARLISFSPDGKWLCIIRPENDLILARINESTISTHITKVTRLNRHTDKLALMGGLGNYNRTITQVAFSDDSRLLAVSDLAGYIDSFLLTGDQDIINETPSVLGSDSESDEEDEECSRSREIYGQRWIRNPAAASIPQLPAAPTVLSFRPRVKDFSNTTVSDPSKDLNMAEDRLLVVTATSEVFEFRLLEGRLSEWSRRNPPATFPEKYKRTLEIVRGVIWDVGAAKERVWLYSVGWLWMFDLGQNFGGQKIRETSLKRKRGKSGAGGSMDVSVSDIGVGKISSRITHGEIDEESETSSHDDTDIDMDIDDDETFYHPSHPSKDIKADHQSDNRKEEEAVEELEARNILGSTPQTISNIKPFSSYHTFKYRPIVGLAVLGTTDTNAGPEVALVERPIWETDLPARYYGEQEWRNQEVDV